MKATEMPTKTDKIAIGEQITQLGNTIDDTHYSRVLKVATMSKWFQPRIMALKQSNNHPLC